MNLEVLSNNLEIKYYKNIINYCKKSNTDYQYFDKKLKELKNIEASITESETAASNHENQNNTSESKEVVYSDDYLYKKKWTKLSNVHKIIKVKEFVSKLLIDNKTDKDNLKNELIGLIKSRYLTKKDKVKYDESKGKVIAIPVLTYKNGKYSIKK